MRSFVVAVVLIGSFLISSIGLAQRGGGPSPGGGGGFGGGGGGGGFGGGGFGGGNRSPGGGGYGGGYNNNPGRPSPGGPSYPGQPNHGQPNPGGAGWFGGNRHNPTMPNPAAPGRPYVPTAPGWSVTNPLSANSRILPSTGRVDLSQSAAPMRGPMSPETNQIRSLAQANNATELTNHFNRVTQGGKNLDSMFATVNAMHGIKNPAVHQLRTTTLNAARSEIAAGAKTAMPWAIVAQMSLQDNNQTQFNEAADRLGRDFPQSEYNYFFSGIRHLQNREFGKAEEALKRARELGISEESIAELLKTAIDNQKWIWEYATILSIVIVVWLGGLAMLYLIGRSLSKRTLRKLDAAPETLSAGDRRARTIYRWVIDIAGIYYYVSLPIVVVVSLALPAALGYAALMVPYLNVLLLVAVFVLGLGGIITAVSGIRTAFVRVSDFEGGRVVAADELPALWAVVREAAEKVGTRPVDEIRLVQGDELAVYEKGSYLQRMRDRGCRVLVLGLGVLTGLKLESFKAILAHEYGHFQNRDTAGGDVALRVYQSMNGFAEAIVARGTIRRWDVAVHFLILYHRLFRRLTFGASRLQEIFADRLAVAHYGAAAFREGLTQVIRRSIELDWAIGKTLDDVVRTGRPVMQFYRSAPLPDLSEREQIETVLAQVIARPTDADDSHPSPQDRFRLAAQLDPRTEPVKDEFVATLLHADPKLAAELDASLDGKIAERAAEVRRDYDRGIAMLNDIARQNDNAEARFERARLHLEKGSYPEAIRDLDHLVLLAPDAGPIRHLRGQVYQKLGRFAEAATEFAVAGKSLETEKPRPGSEEAADLERTRQRVLLRTAECLESAERAQEAGELYDRVLAKNPKSLAALIGRGRTAVALKAATKALADFNAAVEHWPTSAEALQERGELYARCGRTQQAEDDRRAATAIDLRVVAARMQPAVPTVQPVAQRQPAAVAAPVLGRRE